MVDTLAHSVITVSCHGDLSASDLVGRYLIKGDQAVRVDGPMRSAVRNGAIIKSKTAR